MWMSFVRILNYDGASPKQKGHPNGCPFCGIPRQSRYFQLLSYKFPMWDCRTYLSYNEVQDHQTFEYKAAHSIDTV